MAISNAIEVWDGLWAGRAGIPDERRDGQLLARERSGPRWNFVRERLEGELGAIRGLRTIELGSGRGDMSALLAEAGADATLLDSSQKALDAAQARFQRLHLPAQFQCADMMGAAENGGEFDVSVSLGVVEHFVGDDRTRAIRAHLDVLRPGGVALISVPYRWCPPYRVWKAYLELRGWWPYGVERPFGKRELLYRARQAGFRAPIVHLFGFWQSVGDHWIKRLRGHGPDWSRRHTWLDRSLGSTLVLVARAPGAPKGGDPQ